MPDPELLELHVVGLGPIEEARLDLGPGLNALTGETGAGKTLLVGALSLCLGEPDTRGLASAGRFRATALFSSRGSETALTRESDASGRLRGSLDGLATSAAALRTRGEELVIVHGQHDSLRLRSRGEALRLIDAYGRVDDGPLREARSRRRALEARRSEIGGDAASRSREVEFLRYQIDEIDVVGPTGPEELDEALNRLVDLTALRDGQAALVEALAAIDGESETAALTVLAAALRRIPDVGRAGTLRARLHELVLEVRETSHELAELAQVSTLDDDEISRVEARVQRLQDLVRKHGSRLDDVLVRRQQFADRLDDLERSGVELDQLDEECRLLDARISDLESDLRDRRQEVARAFASAVTAQLPRVALSAARVEARIDGSDGSQVELLYAPAPQVAAGPIDRLASGGELARVMLAISLETVAENVVAVFDEVDAGIGGATAQQIGECLAELARDQQVIVVTHLASVAARADRHFVVQSRDGDSAATVRRVEGDERVGELARMLSGDRGVDESRALARRLLAG